MRRPLVRGIVGRLLPRRTRQWLELGTMSVDQAGPPELVPVPSARSVLVLAPHPDDEVVGCGGTLHLHSRAGTKVTVVYMTDGSLGSLHLHDPGLARDHRASLQAVLVETRKAEAIAAGRLLGTGESVFLDFPDGKLRCSEESVRRVANLLVAHRPGVVYVPFPTDRHRDHVETARIFSAAVGKAPEGCEVFAYEVWSPLYPNCMVDISDVVEVKREALSQFKTQLRETNFLHSILGLNAYRAAFHLGGRGFAEAFFRCSPPAFRRISSHLVGAFD